MVSLFWIFQQKPCVLVLSLLLMLARPTYCHIIAIASKANGQIKAILFTYVITKLGMNI